MEDFSTDQYVLEIVDGSTNSFEKREQYICLGASVVTPGQLWMEWKIFKVLTVVVISFKTLTCLIFILD